MGETPFLQNGAVKALEDENQSGVQESSPDSSSSESGADHIPASGVADPVVDAPMVATDTVPSNAGSSCCGVSMPMTPGLPPLTPEWVPVPSPDDFTKCRFLLL